MKFLIPILTILSLVACSKEKKNVTEPAASIKTGDQEIKSSKLASLNQAFANNLKPTFTALSSAASSLESNSSLQPMLITSFLDKAHSQLKNSQVLSPYLEYKTEKDCLTALEAKSIVFLGSMRFSRYKADSDGDLTHEFNLKTQDGSYNFRFKFTAWKWKIKAAVDHVSGINFESFVDTDDNILVDFKNYPLIAPSSCNQDTPIGEWNGLSPTTFTYSILPADLSAAYLKYENILESLADLKSKIHSFSQDHPEERLGPEFYIEIKYLLSMISETYPESFQ